MPDIKSRIDGDYFFECGNCYAKTMKMQEQPVYAALVSHLTFVSINEIYEYRL